MYNTKAENKRVINQKKGLRRKVSLLILRNNVLSDGPLFEKDERGGYFTNRVSDEISFDIVVKIFLNDSFRH